jgi:type I restriction enzyme R subunit
MPNFISEDDIEQALLQRLQHPHGYDVHNAFTSDPADLNDGSGRADKRAVILPQHLKEALVALNPRIPEASLIDAIKQLGDHRQAMPPVAANRELDGLIRDGVPVA